MFVHVIYFSMLPWLFVNDDNLTFNFLSSEFNDDSYKYLNDLFTNLDSILDFGFNLLLIYSVMWWYLFTQTFSHSESDLMITNVLSSDWLSIPKIIKYLRYLIANLAHDSASILFFNFREMHICLNEVTFLFKTFILINLVISTTFNFNS